MTILACLEWLLENLPLIDRLAAASTLSKEEEGSALLNEMPEKMDYRLKIPLLYRQFKLEQDSPSRPPCERGEGHRAAVAGGFLHRSSVLRQISGRWRFPATNPTTTGLRPAVPLPFTREARGLCSSVR